jgi:hypothetical protein
VRASPAPLRRGTWVAIARLAHILLYYVKGLIRAILARKGSIYAGCEGLFTDPIFNRDFVLEMFCYLIAVGSGPTSG